MKNAYVGYHSCGHQRTVGHSRGTHPRTHAAPAECHDCFHGILFAVFALAAAIVVFCSVFWHACHVQASSDAIEHKYKYYQNVVLDNQDSLDKIAQQYADPAYYRNTREYLDEVIHINHLTVLDGEIQHCTPGTHLIVPYYSAVYLE